MIRARTSVHTMGLIATDNAAICLFPMSETAREIHMQWPEITDADLNAFVDLELDAHDLMRVTVHLLAEPEAARRVRAYARQRNTLAALRAEIDAHRSNRRVKNLEDELCRTMRRQAGKRPSSARLGDGAADEPRAATPSTVVGASHLATGWTSRRRRRGRSRADRGSPARTSGGVRRAPNADGGNRT
jgi:anti-sigma factor RsiW